MTQRSINSTPTTSGGLTALLNKHFEEHSAMMHTAIPARVTEVNYDEGWVSVQPLIKAVIKKPLSFVSREEVAYPGVYEVPLFQMSAGRGKAFISVPVKVGDVGGLFFSERDTDTFLTTSGDKVVDSANYSTHSQDGNPNAMMFIPELFTASGSGKIDPENIVIKNETSETKYHPDGTIESTNGSISSILKPDGAGELVNSSGHMKLQSSGIIDLNGFIINVDGSATSPVSVGAPTMAAATSLTVAGKEMNGHKHSAGTYKDGNNDPVTGQSGGPV